MTYERARREHGPGARSVRRQRYAAFVRRGMEEQLRPPWESAWHGLGVGSEAFLERVQRELGRESGEPELTGSNERARGRSAENVAGALAERLGVNASAWVAERRSDSGERAVAAYGLRRLLGYRRGAVAAALGYRSASSVAHGERRVRDSRWLND